MYKNAKQSYESIKKRFEDKIKDKIQTGSVIDIYNKVIGEECGDMYQFIEDNKNPYLFTNTNGKDLDSLGEWVGIPRQGEETDDHYKFRLKDWVLSSEKSNTTAIQNALLVETKSASNIQYVPYTHGSGTGTCYIIPKEYREDIIKSAIKEAENLLKNVISPSLYIEYIVPMMKAVKLHCYLSTSGDASSIKKNISKNLQVYINSAAPGEYVTMGELLKIGLNEPGVDYFNIITVYVDEEQLRKTKIIQELETKLIFDDIIWTDEE